MAAVPFGWIGTAFFVAEIALLLVYIGNIVNLFVQFKATGDVRFLQEALIQIAAGLTIAAIMPSIKEDLEDMKAGVTDLVNSLKSTPEYPTTPGGGCFTAGTLISTPNGFVSIEDIKAGDTVWSFDQTTLEVSEKTVEKTFVRQSDDFVKITTGSETITATSNHPFYVAQKGFVDAIELRAGDILITVNGEFSVVNKVQHEILEYPIDVFNFSVGNNHTYFVGYVSVGVHNHCGQEPGGLGNQNPKSYINKNPSKANKLALGVRENLYEFAESNNAYTFEDFVDTADWKNGVLQALYDPEMEILFNLDGIDNPMASVQRAASGNCRATEWELFQIFQDKNIWSKVTWFQNGEIVPNPFT